MTEINLRFVRKISDAVTIETGQTLEIWRGWVLATDEKIFSGYIEKHEPEGGIVSVIGIDKIWDLVRKEFTHTYDKNIDASAGKISEIFKDIVTTYGGLTADATSIQDSGTTLLLDKFVCNHTDPFERCKKLADILDWQFYYSASTDKVYFEPKGYNVNSNVLQVGTNIIEIPKWQYDITEMANDITVVGATQEVETTESGQIGVTSGYTNNYITLSSIPTSVKVYGDAANPPTTLKTGGQVDSTETYDYSVDTVNKKILPAPSTTFTTNHYYEIRYSLMASIPIHLYNQSSIDAYGQFKKTVTFTDIKSIADAETRGINYLSKYSTPFIYSTLKVKSVSTYGLNAGQTIKIVDSVNSPSVNELLFINKIRIRYPADYEELDIGDKYWRLAEWQSAILERLKRLDEDEYANTDISNELIGIDNDLNSPIPLKNRYVKWTYQDIGGTGTFILGSPYYGLMGTGELGDGDIGSETDSYVCQYENYYNEYFATEDFKSSSYTTADWNTSTYTLDFDAGEVGQSDAIDLNNSTITTATMTVTLDSGSCEYFMTIVADGYIYDGVISNCSYVAGTVGSYALSFNGSNSYVELPASPAGLRLNTGGSISAWIYLNSFGESSAGRIIDKGTDVSSTNGYNLRVVGPTGLHFSVNGATIISTGTITTGAWTHVAVTFGGGQYILYINGVASSPVSSATLPPSVAGVVHIGNRASATDRTFDGYIDQLCVYSAVLTPAQIATLYAKGNVTSNLIAKYEFEENTGSVTAFDTARWERIDSGTAHTFIRTDDGTGLRWKIVEKEGSTAVVSRVIIEDYHV